MTVPLKLNLQNQYGEQSLNLVLSGSTALSGMPTSISTLNAVGATTIPASNFVAGVTKRTGATADFTDTTTTAVLLFAAVPSAYIGQTFKYTYINNTLFQATVHAGVGVTLTDTVIPAGYSATFLVTFTSKTATAITLIGIQNNTTPFLRNKYGTGTTTGTFTAGQLTGANNVFYLNTNATPGTILTRTAVLMIGDITNAVVGQTWIVRILNSGGTTLTVGAGVGVTITGTATIATATWTEFLCTIATGTTITMQNIGSGVAS